MEQERSRSRRPNEKHWIHLNIQQTGGIRIQKRKKTVNVTNDK